MGDMRQPPMMFPVLCESADLMCPDIDGAEVTAVAGEHPHRSAVVDLQIGIVREHQDV